MSQVIDNSTDDQPSTASIDSQQKSEAEQGTSESGVSPEPSTNQRSSTDNVDLAQPSDSQKQTKGDEDSQASTKDQDAPNPPSTAEAQRSKGFADFFPSGPSVWTRLTKQHIATLLALGGLYPAAASDTITAILAPQDGEKKRVLELGTGTGAWAIEFAKKFPHVEVVGIDLSPVPIDPKDLPPNCRFEIEDFQKGLTDHQNQFDLVQARNIASGIKDANKTMADARNCLKPGGMLLWMEPDRDWFTPDIHVCQPLGSEENPTGTWLGRLVCELVRSVISLIGSDFDGVEKILDRGFWSEPFFDPETCKTASLYMPIGPWQTHENTSLLPRLEYIGELMREAVPETYKGARLILAKGGWPVETLNEWERLADEEMSTLKSPIQARFRIAWGRRRAGPDEPAPALPSVAETSVEEDPLLSIPYPFLYVYDTEEQALKEDTLRKQSKEGFIDPPLPST